MVRLVVSLVLALALPSLAQERRAESLLDEKRPSLVPPWVPRQVALGTFIQEGAITPTARLQWEITLLQMRNDALVLAFEGSGGFGLLRPSTMTMLYQHALLGGIAYRATYSNNTHWGFQILTGPIWYGANFSDAPAENRFDGVVDGRAQLGYRLGRVHLGVMAGWAQIYNRPTRGNPIAHRFIGGPYVGLFADWRD